MNHRRSKPLPHERCTETHVKEIIVKYNGRTRAHRRYTVVTCPLFKGHEGDHVDPS